MNPNRGPGRNTGGRLSRSERRQTDPLPVAGAVEMRSCCENCKKDLFCVGECSQSGKKLLEIVRIRPNMAISGAFCAPANEGRGDDSSRFLPYEPPCSRAFLALAREDCDKTNRGHRSVGQGTGSPGAGDRIVAEQGSGGERRRRRNSVIKLPLTIHYITTDAANPAAAHLV
jgi:hypothetical protein